MAEENQKVAFTTVSALRPDTTGHNLIVKVVEAKPILEKSSRPNAKPIKITECLVGDETATILLPARNEQGESLKPGTYVTLRNAKVEMFRGNMRLAVDKFGKIEPAEGATFTPKLDNNMSLVEFELVPIPQGGAVEAKEETPAEVVEVAEEP